jgi:hypothetical protein
MKMFVLFPLLIGFTISCENNVNRGTGTGSTSGSDASNREHAIIKVLGGTIDTRTSLEDEIGDILNKKFNTEIQFISFTGNRWERALMMLASQDFGGLDIITTANDDTTARYVDAGVFVKLDDYRAQLTNFWSFEADLIPYWRDFDKKNGDLYVWQSGPDQGGLVSVGLDMMVRVDLLEQAGWPNIDTTDDYIAFLKDALIKNPQTGDRPSIGMAGPFGVASLSSLLASYLPRHSGYQHPYKMTALIDPDSGKFIPQLTHPYAKETARFWNTLWREQILDREAFTDDFDTVNAKWRLGLPLVVFFNSWDILGMNTAAIERGEPEKQYIDMPIRLQIAKDEKRNKRYELYNGIRPDDTNGILKSSKNIDRIIELLDFFATEEMGIRLGWGVEGRDYTINNDGKRVPMPEFIAAVTGPEAENFLQKRGIDSYENNFPFRYFALSSNGQPFRFQNDPSFMLLSATDVQKKAYNAYGWETPADAFSKNKNFEFIPFDVTLYVSSANLDPDSDLAKTEEKIINYINQQYPLVLSANTEAEFERQYKILTDTVLSYGLEDVVAQYNKQLNEIEGRINELKRR